MLLTCNLLPGQSLRSYGFVLVFIELQGNDDVYVSSFISVDCYFSQC